MVCLQRDFSCLALRVRSCVLRVLLYRTGPANRPLLQATCRAVSVFRRIRKRFAVSKEQNMVVYGIQHPPIIDPLLYMLNFLPNIVPFLTSRNMEKTKWILSTLVTSASKEE